MYWAYNGFLLRTTALRGLRSIRVFNFSVNNLFHWVVSEFEDLLCALSVSSASFAFELPFNAENTENAEDAEETLQLKTPLFIESSFKTGRLLFNITSVRLRY